jgi:hypothetical protein
MRSVNAMARMSDNHGNLDKDVNMGLSERPKWGQMVRLFGREGQYQRGRSQLHTPAPLTQLDLDAHNHSQLWEFGFH